MEAGNESNTLVYKRARFVTFLPRHYLYTSSHYWLMQENGLWRVGLGKFATRMLGEIVDYGFELEPGAEICWGQSLGWMEGFKGIEDVISFVEGRFQRINPGLSKDPEMIDRDCYGTGWLYEARGRPDSACLKPEEYTVHLDRTIDRLIEEQQSGGSD
jgi:glycine cleavage system H protein